MEKVQLSVLPELCAYMLNEVDTQQKLYEFSRRNDMLFNGRTSNEDKTELYRLLDHKSFTGLAEGLDKVREENYALAESVHIMTHDRI